MLRTFRIGGGVFQKNQSFVLGLLQLEGGGNEEDFKNRGIVGRIISLLCCRLSVGHVLNCNKYPFTGAADNERDDLDYYYINTGGKFPTGTIPNGDNASGGTIRYLLDDPGWGSYPLDTWNKDDWFPQNAGFALTLKKGNATLYDNNGLEDGSYGTYYDGQATLPNMYGLYRGYSMSNNWDWIYASYFMLTSPTTFDTIIGYFDGDGYYGNFNPRSPSINYRMNIWSSYLESGTSYMPTNTGGFSGDVLTTDCVPGYFMVSATGVDRIKPSGSDWVHDPIWRLVFKATRPVTLPVGVYFFSHDAIVGNPLSMASFKIKEAKIDWTKKRGHQKKSEDDDWILIKGSFKLGSGSNGVQIADLVTVKVGNFTQTIQMESEHGCRDDKKWEFKERYKADGISTMMIEWNKTTAEFILHIDDIDLGDQKNWANPVTISIQIGDDISTTSVQMKAHNNQWSYNSSSSGHDHN